MATSSLSAGPAPANAPTRRLFVVGALALPVLAATPALASPAPDRTAWDRAMREHAQAQAASDAFDRDHWRPASDAYQHAVGSLPHYRSTAATPVSLPVPDTADQSSLRWARIMVDGGMVECDGAPAYLADCRRALDHADWREAARKRLYAVHGLDRLDERSEALGEAAFDLETLLMGLPAPDVAALTWKLERLIVWDAEDFTPSWSRDYAEPALADARRLAGARSWR